MPPVVAAAAIAGGAQLATNVIGSRAQSGANKRAIDAQERAAQRAEAAATQDRMDADAREAEDKRRWETDQANLASERAERDARQRYEDQIRYRKMVNIARLTGQPMPEPLPDFGAGGREVSPLPRRQPTSEVMSRPSQANAMIQTPEFDPFQAPAQRMPISRLNRRSY